MSNANYFKNFVLLSGRVVLFLVVLLSSCEEKGADGENHYKSYLDGTYQNYSESDKILILSYNGQNMENKEVTFSTKDHKKGTLTFSNIIPGENETKIEIDLNPNEEKTKLLFQGVYKSKSSADIKYSGNIGGGTLSLNLSDK